MSAKNVPSFETITKCSLNIKAFSVLFKWRCQKIFIFTMVITIRKRRPPNNGKNTIRQPETFCE
jgi:hypothetical protein